MFRIERSLVISILFLCTFHLISYDLIDQEDDSGEQEEYVNASPNLAADSTNIAYLAVGGDLRLPYYRTYDIDVKNTAVTAALIFVHGGGRNAIGLLRTVIEVAQSVGSEISTFIITPHFQNVNDEVPLDEPYWSRHGWLWGEESLIDDSRTHSISSFDPVDQLIIKLSDNQLFPNLISIIIAGHSAGGQFVHRYATGTRIEESLLGISVRYVVMNPSTFVYVRPERVIEGTIDEFEIPMATDCQEYNSWPYGFDTSPPYYSNLTLTQVQTQLKGRDVVYLAGDADTLSRGLDQSCGAMYTGPNRFLRAQIMKNFMDTFFPGHSHILTVVEGVGHHRTSMMSSAEGLSFLFN